MFATLLASVAVIAFISANVRKYLDKKAGKFTDAIPMPRIYGYLYSFTAGVVTANGLFHFLHGILGYSEFPAPFAKVIGHGIPTEIANIIWGLFNFTAALVLIIRCKKSVTRWILLLFFMFGVIVMSLLLRFVLLSGYFATHPF